jgi:hypothetical protein
VARDWGEQREAPGRRCRHACTRSRLRRRIGRAVGAGSYRHGRAGNRPGPSRGPPPQAVDFPHGWASGLNPLTALSSSNGACRAGDAGLSQSAYAGPASFSRVTFTAVTGTTTVWQTEREASAAYARAIAPRAVKCLADAFAHELRAWVRGGFHVQSPTTTVSTLRVVGDESRAFQVEVPSPTRARPGPITSTTRSSASTAEWRLSQ